MSSPSSPSHKRTTPTERAAVSGTIGTANYRVSSNASKSKRKFDLGDEPSSQSGRITTVEALSNNSRLASGSAHGRKRSAGHSIANLPSSQDQGERESSEEPRLAKRRSILHTPESKTSSRGARGALSESPIAPTSFAEMYKFATKNAAAQQKALVDLTQSPQRNGLYNGVNKSLFNPHSGPKKIVVKTLKKTPVRIERTDLSLDPKWQDQEAALDRLFAGQDNKLLLEELYAGGEAICRQGYEREMSAKVKAKCIAHLDGKIRVNLRSIAESAPSVEALKAFIDTWSLWQSQLQVIRHLFFYLNQTYLVRSADELVLDVMGLQQFRAIVFSDAVIQPQVIKGAIELIDRDRKGTASPQEINIIEQAIGTFHDLNVYTSDFEAPFVIASEAHYRSWRVSEAETSDLPHYVRAATALISREIARCDRIGLDRSTRSELLALCDTTLVEENTSRLTDTDSLLDMFEENLTLELEQTYNLLARKQEQQALSVSFAKFIEMEGSLIVFDEKREAEMVIRLLEFKRKLDTINKHSFHGNESLDNTLHKAFEVFMNKTKKTQSTWDTDNAKPGEMIAKHVDLLLKGGPKAVPGLQKDAQAGEDNDFDGGEGGDDAEVEKHLDNALDLFRFVHGKAVFEAFYKKDLARRLLMGRTQSFDAERSMLARLRNECGAGFTHNLESMFKDMDLAREEMKSYNQLLSDRGTRPNPDLTVNVLSVAAWPTYPDIAVNLPTNISKAQADFEKHYKSKHVGRRLHWKPSLATCQLKSKFSKGNKEIVVSGFQAVVLLLFNDVADDGALTYAQIKAASSLPDNELIRTLQSLACARYRVLNKTPRGREVNSETDKFSFNASFTDPKLRIKINQIQLKETKEENKETHQRVAADRHYETQAAIVRIMKSRKVISHNELIVEVIKATRSRGVLDQTDIKRNIEKLIEKEYMERDEDGKNQYKYLA